MNLNSKQARIDAQLEMETQSVQQGVLAYRESLRTEGNAGVSAGQQLIRAAMGPMIERLKQWLEETAEGLASRNASIYYFINEMDPDTVAWITAHCALNMLHETPPLTRTAMVLAQNLESTQNLDAILKANPRLGKKVVAHLEKIKEGRNRAVFIRKGTVLADVKVVKWDDSTRERVGVTLLALFEESTGLIAQEDGPVMRNNKVFTVLRATESCRVWLEESHARCELLQPYRMPMVSMPRDWTNPFNGGYLTHKLRQPLVKTRNKGYLDSLKEHDMPWVYASVNALQATEWAVNTRIMAVVDHLWKNKLESTAMPGYEDDPLPTRPWAEGDEPAPEALQTWKVAAARNYERNGKMKSKRQQLVQKLVVAEKMIENGNSFHYVYNLDWRGRMYPVGPALTPQGDDIAKGLLHFAQGSRLGDDGAYWLAVHTSNSFGVDKVSFEDRVKWVQENEQAIIECGKDPCATASGRMLTAPSCSWPRAWSTPTWTTGSTQATTRRTL